MKTIQIPGFIHYRKEVWETEGKFNFLVCEDLRAMGYSLVCPHTLSFDLPDDFDPTQAQLSVLKAQKQKLSEEFNANVARINDEISKLQSLTYSGGHELAREAAERTGETPLEGHLA